MAKARTSGKTPRRRQESPRRALERARTRQDILTAAVRVLARSGFNAVTMQEIGREVGLTAPALYAYFDSKEQIFDDLLAQIADELMETYAPPPPEARTLREKLAALVRRQLEWADQRREVFAMFAALHMRGDAPPSPGHGSRARQSFDPFIILRRLTDWIRREMVPGEIGDHDPETAAMVLHGISHGFFLRWMGEGSIRRLSDHTDRILDIFFHGLVGVPPRPRGE